MSNIKVGDLVMIMRCCCARAEAEHLGTIHSILTLGDGAGWNAACCGYKGGELDARLFERPSNKGWFKRHWLKRIPPLEELEGRRTEEKLKEPA